MKLDYYALSFWVNMGNYAVTLSIGIYVWWDKRQAKLADRFAAIETRFVAHEKRFTEIEQWFGTMRPRVNGLEAELEKARRLCKAHHDQTARIDKRQGQLPTREELEKLTQQMGDLAQNLSRMDGRLSGVGRAVDLMNQHLLRVGDT